MKWWLREEACFLGGDSEWFSVVRAPDGGGGLPRTLAGGALFQKQDLTKPSLWGAGPCLSYSKADECVPHTPRMST